MMRDYMVDVETTGTRPDRAALLQVALVQFDLDTLTIHNERMFMRTMVMPAWRGWDEDTRAWWRKQSPAVFEKVTENPIDPRAAMDAMVQFVVDDGGRVDERRFWAKNAAFDWGFVSSYLHDYEISNPFSFRGVRDIRTFLEGVFHPAQIPDVETVVSDQEHNALVDCIMQIDWLFKVMAHARPHA